ncbi:MAG TPA: maleylpyruvate isomerase N-terminal domain-containing protein, partial [Actinoplanes sp.]
MMDSALRGGCAVLERAVAYALGNLALVSAPLLARPTPCPRWDLATLLRHLADSMAAVQEAADEGRVARTSPPAAGPVIPLVRDRAVG